MLKKKKKAVTKCWLQKSSPSVGLFAENCKPFASQQMTCTLSLQKDMGEKPWEKLNFCLPHNADSVQLIILISAVTVFVTVIILGLLMTSCSLFFIFIYKTTKIKLVYFS